MLHHRHEKPISPKRVVVLGGNGFIGRSLVSNLVEKGIQVASFGSKDIDLSKRGAGAKLAERLEPEDALVAVSAKAPARNIDDLQLNLSIMREIRLAIDTARPRHVVNIGSDAVFCDGPLPLKEDSAKAPGSIHGLMHLARELAFGGSDIPLVTIRPTLIYGPNDPHNGYGPNSFGRLALKNANIILFGEGEERRDHVYVGDVAELIARVILYDSIGSVNAATGSVWSFREIASMIVERAETTSRIESSERKGEMPHGGLRTFDPTAVYQAFPDFTFTSLNDGVLRLVTGIE